MHERQRMLATLRDVFVIVGVALLTAFAVHDYLLQARLRREEEVRFNLVQQAIARLDEAYRQKVTGSSDFNQVLLQQNQLLIELQKLLLQVDVLPGSVSITQQPVTPGPPGGAVNPAEKP